MKKTYVPAELELIKLTASDIITISGPEEDTDSDDGGYNQGGWT